MRKTLEQIGCRPSLRIVEIQFIMSADVALGVQYLVARQADQLVALVCFADCGHMTAVEWAMNSSLMGRNVVYTVAKLPLACRLSSTAQ